MNGKDLFVNKCASCHQLDGEGVPPAFPPLAKSDFLQNLTRGKGRPRLVSIVRAGLRGQITVNGLDYDGYMPPAGADLSDAEVAAVLTYVTNEWGNEAEPFTEEEVKSTGSTRN